MLYTALLVSAPVVNASTSFATTVNSKTNDTTLENKSRKKTKAKKTSSLNSVVLKSEVKEVLAGEVAPFKLKLNISKPAKATTATLVVNLPEKAELATSLNDLTIGEVTPVLKNGTLRYEFKELTKGISVNKKLSLKTKNGFTPNGTELSVNGELEIDGKSSKTDTAVITILSEATFALTNKFSHKVGDDSKVQIPDPGEEAVWNFNITSPKAKQGIEYIKEGTDLTYKLILDEGLTFVSMENNQSKPTVNVINTPGSPNYGKQELTWVLPAPSYEEQGKQDSVLQGHDFSLRLKVAEDAKVFESLMTSLTASATFVGGEFKSISHDGSLMVGPDDKKNPPPITAGGVYAIAHRGALDGHGNVSTESNNPDPDVYEGAQLNWQVMLTSGMTNSPHLTNDMKDYTVVYELDKHLDFTGFAAGGADYRPNSSYPENVPLLKQPNYDLYVKYADEADFRTKPNYKDVKPGNNYTPKVLGIEKGKKVDKIMLKFNYAPAGMYGPTVAFGTTPEKGYFGKITNHATVQAQGVRFSSQGGIFKYNEKGVFDLLTNDYIPGNDKWLGYMGVRSANVIAYPEGDDKVINTTVGLTQTAEDETVISGDNKVQISLVSDESSLATIKGPFESFVALPKGVTLDETAIKDLSHSIKVIENDFQGKGKQLVDIKWDAERIVPKADLTESLPVHVDVEKAPKTLNFELFTTIKEDQKVKVPESSQELGTKKVEDTFDIDKDGDTKEFILKNDKKYASVRDEALIIATSFNNKNVSVTEGINEADLGDTVTGVMDIHKTSSEVFDDFILMGSVPSLNDSTLVSGEKRKSEFGLSLKKAITLPEDWKNKVSVFYSTTKNPNTVGELDANTDYADQDPIKNPIQGETAKWLSESEVKDFSEMKSFKLVFDKKDKEWVAGSTRRVLFEMAVPESIWDLKVGDVKKAWFTVAAAADKLVPTEAVKTGISVEGKDEFISVTHKVTTGEEYAPAEKMEGKAGEKVTVKSAPLKEGYQLVSVKVDGKEVGIKEALDLEITKVEQKVEFIYGPKLVIELPELTEQPITVTHMTTEGKTYADAEVYEGKIGKVFDVKAAPVKEGYQLVGVKVNNTLQKVSDTVSVKVTGSAQSVVFIYGPKLTIELPELDVQPVSVQHVTTEGKEYAETEILTGKNGEKVTTKAAPLKEGYRIVGVKVNTEWLEPTESTDVTLTGTAQSVTYVYGPDLTVELPELESQPVMVHHVLTTGEEYAQSDVKTGAIGDILTTVQAKLKPGFKLVGVKVNDKWVTPSETIDIKVTAQAQSVTYVYGPDTTVELPEVTAQPITIKHMTSDGKEYDKTTVVEGKNGETVKAKSSALKEGYDLVGVLVNRQVVKTIDTVELKIKPTAQSVIFIYGPKLITELPLLDAQPVKVMYSYNDGQEYAKSTQLSGKIGDKVNPKPIKPKKGDELVGIKLNDKLLDKRSDKELEVTITASTQTVEFIYGPKPVEPTPEAEEHKIKITHVMKDGSEYAPTVVLNGKVGEKVRAKSAKLKESVKLIAVKIDGADAPLNEAGALKTELEMVIGDKDKEVQFIYSKESDAKPEPDKRPNIPVKKPASPKPVLERPVIERKTKDSTALPQTGEDKVSGVIATILGGIVIAGAGFIYVKSVRSRKKD